MKKYHSFGKSAMTALLVTILIGTTLGCSESPLEETSLQSIVITSPPTKTVYALDEALDIGGLVVTGIYSDGTTKAETVSLANVSGYKANTVGQQTLTVTIGGKTATFTVTVKALQSIAIISQPTKTVYALNESLDLSGIVVIGTYSDGTTKVETAGISNVSGYNADTAGQQTLTVTIDGKTATFTVTVSATGDDAVLQSIAITGSPTKTVYTLNEALDISGLVVTGAYSDGTTKTETVSLANVSGYNADTVGTYTLTVTIGGKTATFIVTVSATTDNAVLQSIAITVSPTKTVYTLNEALDISGLVVTGTYSDGTTKVETVSLSAISGYNANTVGQQTLTVTIDGKTATFTVTVSATTDNAVLQSIAITSSPTKTVYTLNEALDISGLVVTGTYSDGTTKVETVSLANLSGYNASTAGQQTLTVTIGGKTATFTVTVNPATLQSIAITSSPTKTVYTLNEALDISGLVVTGAYSDGTTKVETVSLSNVSGYNANTAGTYTLTVTIGGKTATFTVTVSATTDNAVLQSIAITSSPTKTVYTLNEALDISGLVVTGAYSDGTTKTETVSLVNISGYNADTAGQQTLTITIGGKTATFTVTVSATDNAVLQSIAVTSSPTKTVYELSESLDISGLVVTGAYSDGTTKLETVSLANISGYNANTAGTYPLTVTIGGKTATFTVTVNPATLQSIAVTSSPTKTVYELSESLDLSGLVVTGTYSDGTTKTETVSLANISGYNANTAGTYTLTVTIGGKTATFSVTVSGQQTTAAFTVNLADPINGIPANIVLSKSGTPASATLEITGTYAAYAWFLNDNETPVSTTAGYTLNAADCRLGNNFLTVEARTPNGVYYAREITFIVNK
jgi:hypothetical protein